PVLTIMQGVGPFPVALHQGARAGTLGAAMPAEATPEGTDVDLIPASTIKVARTRLTQSHAGRDLSINTGSKGIDFGQGNTIGNITIGGDVAGRDIVKISVTSNQAASANSDEDLARMISALRGDVAKLKEG